MKKAAFSFFSGILSLGFIFGAFSGLPAKAQESVMLSDLIKGENSSAVYYYYGNRYGFPNEDVYFSWYEDFSQVKTVSDAFLASVPLAANMRYRPGTRLIKIESDPKVYFLKDAETLVWVPTEEDARTLYGDDWAKEVKDLSVALFIDYEVEAEDEFFYLPEGEREYVRGLYDTPEDVLGSRSFNFFSSLFAEYGTYNADAYPIPPGVDVTPTPQGYNATTDQPVSTLAPFYLNDASADGWLLVSDEAIAYTEFSGRIMHFEKRLDGSDVKRFLILAEADPSFAPELNVTVAFSEMKVPNGMFFHPRFVPFLSLQKPPTTLVSAVGLLDADELRQWYFDQALSREWIYMGERAADGEAYNELLFKSQKSHDWFILTILDIDSGEYLSQDSTGEEQPISVISMLMIDVRD